MTNIVQAPLAASGVLALATVVATHEIAEVFMADGIRAGRRNTLRRSTAPPSVLIGTPLTASPMLSD